MVGGIAGTKRDAQRGPGSSETVVCHTVQRPALLGTVDVSWHSGTAALTGVVCAQNEGSAGAVRWPAGRRWRQKAADSVRLVTVVRVQPVRASAAADPRGGLPCQIEVVRAHS